MRATVFILCYTLIAATLAIVTFPIPDFLLDLGSPNKVNVGRYYMASDLVFVWFITCFCVLVFLCLCKAVLKILKIGTSFWTLALIGSGLGTLVVTFYFLLNHRANFMAGLMGLASVKAYIFFSLLGAAFMVQSRAYENRKARNPH